MGLVCPLFVAGFLLPDAASAAIRFPWRKPRAIRTARHAGGAIQRCPSLRLACAASVRAASSASDGAMGGSADRNGCGRVGGRGYLVFISKAVNVHAHRGMHAATVSAVRLAPLLCRSAAESAPWSSARDCRRQSSAPLTRRSSTRLQHGTMYIATSCNRLRPIATQCPRLPRAFPRMQISGRLRYAPIVLPQRWSAIDVPTQCCCVATWCAALQHGVLWCVAT